MIAKQNIGLFVLILILLIFSIDFVSARSYQLQNDTTRISFDEFVKFKDVEVSPIFSGCNKWEEDCEKRNCFDQSIMKLLRNNIKDGFEKEEKFISDPLRAKVRFVVDTTGVVSLFDVTGDDKILNKYAQYAISKLSKTPRILPGKKGGELIAVLYEVNIIAKTLDGKNRKTTYTVGKDYGKSFEEMVFDNQVIHPECKETGKAKKDKKCLNEKVKKFINKNFNVNIAKNLNLEGVYTIYVRFSISKCGNVINVKARGPHPDLEKEAIRVVKTLPKMKPASFDGEPIGVLYALPVKFAIK
ncbi:hypothetical protein GCM10009430_13800 [Aquimarina litoralis]|uniref:TonB C-terminal domain-containing protein n=1 Tax=Aquimarina litoralis TaxID=584605 RepID=A0ABN1IMP2_9FLAO